ncbi:hypothetical protein HHL11_09100 [Ramlibacter sp. G-1-2-2]|uniref:DUF4148 domain-containing protein n=1 Tax=Ramlibacter agri TaxID=2728837 RepID=A0A848H011_9BURK|nr:hypothetical protein [Ramlibacter agri]NML43904.1 hypothetical protein [Ramlibacter agri]
MNRYLLATVVCAGAALANMAFAENYGEGWDPQPTFHSTMTRAEVAAGVQQGQAQAFTGEDSGSAYLAAHAPASTTTRADAVADYKQSRNEVAAMNGEDSGSMMLAQARRMTPRPVHLAVFDRKEQ